MITGISTHKWEFAIEKYECSDFGVYLDLHPKLGPFTTRDHLHMAPPARTSRPW